MISEEKVKIMAEMAKYEKNYAQLGSLCMKKSKPQTRYFLSTCILRRCEHPGSMMR